MTTASTSRAQPAGLPRRGPRRIHPASVMAVGLVLVLAGLLVAMLAARGGTARHGTTAAAPPAAASPAPRPEAGRAPRGAARAPAQRPAQAPVPPVEHSRRAQRLSPLPPADGRDAPDPAVVHDGDRWALFSTQVGFLNVPVAMSDDLREGGPAGRRVTPAADLGRERPHLGARSTPPKQRLRAVLRGPVPRPEPACIGAATADAVEGPYSSPAPEPLVCQPQLGGSIDPQPFVDGDGTAYLLWKADANAIGQTSQIFV